MNDGMVRFSTPIFLMSRNSRRKFNFEGWVLKSFKEYKGSDPPNKEFPVCELKKCPAGQVGGGLECSTLPPHAKCLTKTCFDWECEIGWERDPDPTIMLCHDIDECTISGPLRNWFYCLTRFSRRPWCLSIRRPICLFLDQEKDKNATLDIGQVYV